MTADRAVEAYVASAWRRSPRPSLGQIALEVRERFDLPKFCHARVRQALARLESGDETSARPPWDDPVWLAEVQRRVISEGRREARTRRDPSAEPLRPVHAILRDVPWR